MSSQHNTRFERVTHRLNLAGKGLEFGPLTRPVVAKEIADVLYVDHASTEELKRKYSNDSTVLTDDMCHIDIDLSKGNLLNFVPKNSMDFVIASHVLEHVPDPVSWLTEIQQILKPGGRISLVIPDKRFTFDIRRQLTTTNELLDAFRSKRSAPTLEQVIDQHESAIAVSARWAWACPYCYLLRPKGRLGQGIRTDLEIQLKKGYVDVHCWVWTPLSFLLCLQNLLENKIIALELDWFLETQVGEIEFFVTLKKGAGINTSVLNQINHLTSGTTPLAQFKVASYPQWLLLRAIKRFCLNRYRRARW